MPTPSLQSRLRQIMREMRWSQADLAEAAGASKQAVSRWLRNGHKTIDAKFAFALEERTGISARWILYGEGPVHVVSIIDLEEFPELRRAIEHHISALVAILRREILRERELRHR